MTDAQRAVREIRAAESPLVIIPQESGYRVYAVSDPSRTYEVTEEDGRWLCTCPDFGYHQSDPLWRCKHILAAAPWSANGGQHPQPNGYGGAVPPAALAGTNIDAEPPAASMLIRRSVSPDGRIDSVSVEFTLPVGGDSSGAIKEKALRTLSLQREIVSHFLSGNGKNGNGHAAAQLHPNGGTRLNEHHHPNGGTPNGGNSRPNGGVPGDLLPARIVEVGEVQGKWGPRLCLIFQMNGNHARVFGSAKQLAERLAAAGYPYNPAALHPGLRLNLDCLATTQPSNDGKYVNVDKLYPAHPNGGGR